MWGRLGNKAASVLRIIEFPIHQEAQECTQLNTAWGVSTVNTARVTLGIESLGSKLDYYLCVATDKCVQCSEVELPDVVLIV